jgi:Protein of unknown function (DUF3631)
VMNMGHTRGATVCRMVRGEPLKIRVFAPLAIAAIGSLPFPLLRRSITINMQRPGREQKLDRLDDASPQWAAPANRFSDGRGPASWHPIRHFPHSFATARPTTGEHWWRLQMIWGMAARAAAISLSSNRVYTEPGVALLADILMVFEQLSVERLTSAVLVAALLRLNDGDWNEWRGPKEDRPPHRLTQNELAAMLRPFHIRPRTIWPKKQRRPGDRSSRGYFRSQFEKAWEAYCGADTPTQPSEVIS